MNKYYDIAITTAFGVEAVAKRELSRIGLDNIPAINGTLNFKGSATDIARCNMFLRTADRVYIKITQFKCECFDELFEGVCSAPWYEYISANGSIIVNGKCVNSILYGVSACQSIIKKAIVVSMGKKYGLKQLPENEERYKVYFSITNNVATLFLDTSGDGLHKRGYRDLVGDASIKETLAAAIIQLSVYNADKEFADPFCGSGTFPIEAAMYALNIAPGINRTFDFVQWKAFDNSAFTQAQTEAKDAEHRDRKLKISGFDIDKNAVKLSMHHADNAGVREYLHFQTADANTFSSHKPYGVICTNPPYGERLLSEKEVAALMTDFSATFNRLKDWSLYLITAFPDLENCFGRRADKNRKLFNGKLECRLYQYMGAKPPRKNND